MAKVQTYKGDRQMDTMRNDTPLDRLAARLADLEREVATLRAERQAAVRQFTVRTYVADPGDAQEQTSRRVVLRTLCGVGTALGVAAVVGTRTNTALAMGPMGQTNFVSNMAGVPTIQATQQAANTPAISGMVDGIAVVLNPTPSAAVL